jgi:hypothetical protein
LENWIWATKPWSVPYYFIQFYQHNPLAIPNKIDNLHPHKNKLGDYYPAE